MFAICSFWGIGIAVFEHTSDQYRCRYVHGSEYQYNSGKLLWMDSVGLVIPPLVRSEAVSRFRINRAEFDTSLLSPVYLRDDMEATS